MIGSDRAGYLSGADDITGHSSGNQIARFHCHVIYDVEKCN
ncbi:MAG TPA: hypothetical protein PLP19_16310 [bacterium]|nr:hypothetical protein [bacterium]HPN45056.1 hypothetical protein [bacterium]